jgi:hypothetical protein
LPRRACQSRLSGCSMVKALIVFHHRSR